MSFSINTNVASLQAQNYLRTNSDFQSKTINRVTSGLRIVQSGDDAAGLAIANGYRSDQAVLTQGVRNANDGLSQLQIIDGGMNNISQLLDRARTLATQSASGTFTGDRSVLNSEFQSVLGEIDRQAQAVGLNTGGVFAKSLSVFIGGGKSSNGIDAISNGAVAVDLSKSTVDTSSLGLKGVQAAGVAGTDIGSGSATTSLSQILANSTNTSSQSGGNFTTFYLKGPGFDGQGVKISVNTQNLGSTSDLVTAVNSAIANAANGGTQQATALRNAQINASIVTDANGKSQLAFGSSSAAFQVEAGDRTANALLGNFEQNASVEGSDAAATVDTSTNHSFAYTIDGGTAHTVSVTNSATSFAVSKGQIVKDLNSDATFHSEATASLDGNKIVIKSNSTGSTSSVKITNNALSQALGLTSGSDVTSTAAAASTGASLTTSVQGAGAVVAGENVLGTNTTATLSITAATNSLKVDVGGTNATLTLTQGSSLTKGQVISDLNTQIASSGLNGLVSASVGNNNQIILTAAKPSQAVTVQTVANDAASALGFGAAEGTASTGNTFITADTIKFRFQGAGLTSPVDVTLNPTTAGTTTVADVLADLQTKIAGNSTLAGAGITLSTASAGNNLVFSNSSGQQFQVAVTGDSENKLGLGSFQAGDAGEFDYTTKTAANSYATTSTSGTANLQFSLNGAGSSSSAVSVDLTAGDATAGKTQGTAIAGQVVFTGGAGSLDLAVDGHKISISAATLGTSATTDTTVVLGQINTALHAFDPNASAFLDSTNKLVIQSGTKGSASSVQVLATSNAVYTGALGLTAQVGTVNSGQNSSEADVINRLNSAISANATLSKAGIQVSDDSGKIKVSSSNDTNFRVDAFGGDIGFGTVGSSFTGNSVSAAPASSPAIDSNGADASSVLAFSDIAFGSDKQTVSITAQDASGTKHSLGVVLQNAGAVRNATTIDQAVDTINTALRQSNDPTLQQVVAVKEDVNGSQSIRFLSTLHNFQIAVGSTANGTGITPPTGDVDTSAVVGAGSNSSILDQNSAQNAVTTLSNAIGTLGKAQAAVGKGENQFNYAVNLAQSQLTNLATAESRIRDADLASEAANLTKAQILLQAGVAALAQANSAPQTVLSLLRG